MAPSAASRRTVCEPQRPGAGHPATVGTDPRTYIRLDGDRALAPTTQNLMIAEADRLTPDNPFGVRSLPGDHSPMVHRPGELADLLAGI